MSTHPFALSVGQLVHEISQSGTHGLGVDVKTFHATRRHAAAGRRQAAQRAARTCRRAHTWDGAAAALGCCGVGIVKSCRQKPSQ